MQSEQPQFYAQLCSQISEQDLAVIQDAVVKAEHSAMEQLALQQQQQQQQQGANLQQQPAAGTGGGA
jgi:hypothetical protein